MIWGGGAEEIGYGCVVRGQRGGGLGSVEWGAGSTLGARDGLELER